MTTPDDPPGGLGRGVLRPDRAADAISLSRIAPAPGPARFVEFYWVVRWDRRGLPAHEQQVLSHPNAHLVFESPAARVYGVDRTLFVRRLEGAGRVFGVKFRPGGLRPFTDGPVAALADRSVPAERYFGPEAAALNDRVLHGDEDEETLAARVDALLLARLPAPDPVAEQVAAVVEAITAGTGLRRVDEVAERFGVSVRGLQRLFAEYVGAAPKWVLRRARLHEAAQRADRGAPVDWAALAVELGYADQAHLVRDFAASVGTTPARYAARGGGSD